MATESRGRGEGPQPLGPTTTRRPGHGQLRPRLRVSLHEAGEVLTGLERAHREQVRPEHAEAREQRLGARAVRLAEMVRSLGHDHEPVVGDADACGQDGIGGRLGRDDDEGGPGGGPAQGGLVPAPAPGRKSLRHRSPGHVVHSRHEGYAPGRGRGRERDGVDEVGPPAHVGKAQVPRTSHERAGQGRARERATQAREGVRARGGRLATMVTVGTLRGRELADALQQAAGVGPDATGDAPAQLLGRQRHRSTVNGVRLAVAAAP